ncbi:FHA domain-containing protein [Planctomycetota bacterium]|nr:FHA domain-containing protein [Planctomycetota bacterium]
MPRIVFKKNELPPVELSQAMIFGRSEKHSNVVVKDNRLSRAHCRMEQQDDDTWMVADLGSQNGTFVNGRRVKECMIKAGDVIRIGAVDMLFEVTGGPGGATVMAGVESGRMPPSSSNELDLADDGIAKPTINAVEGTRTVVAPAALVLLKGTLQDKLHPLTADVFTIGRKKDNHLCLEGDGKSSGHHANIRKDGENWIVEDLGSTNGVSVNGQQIEGPTILKTGSKLVVGQQMFRFQLQGKPLESSGETAPQLAQEDMQQAANEAGAEAVVVAESPDSQTVYDNGGGAAAADSPQEDMSALTQEISYKGGSGGLFSIIEIIVAIAVVGGILYAGWTFHQSSPPVSGNDGGSFDPARSGDLLTLNPSFDDGGEARTLKNWNISLAGTDSVAVVEGGHGGPYALQISRFSPSNQMTTVYSDRIETNGETGISVSAFAVNSEAAQNRFGTGVLSIWWFGHKSDRDPILVTALASATKLNEWTEISGSTKRPTGAQAYSIVLGLAGQKGSIAFDDIKVSKADDAPAMFTSNSLKKDGLEWAVDESGNVTLRDDKSTLFQYGAVYLYHGDGTGDPLDPLQTLNASPTSSAAGNLLSLRYPYFDALGEKAAQLAVSLEIKGGKASFSASIQPVDGKSLDGTAGRIGFSALCSSQFAPAELLRIENDNVAGFHNEIGPKTAKEFQRVLAANTGTGNTILNNGGAKISIANVGGGRAVRLASRGSLKFGIELGQGRDDVAERAALCVMQQVNETPVDRVNRALSIFKDYPYCQPELQQAANAVDAVAKHYKLRLIELRDGINVPQLTRNEQLYRAAMTEAILNADLLKQARPGWEDDGMKSLGIVGLPIMSDACRESSKQASEAILELVSVARDFEDLEIGARKALFILEVEIEQRESEPYAVSASDFHDSGQIVQAMVKLRTVVNKYPRCERGVTAKGRVLDIAEYWLNEMDDHKAKKLNNIAMDRAVMARSLLNLVRDNLLTTILSADELSWISSRRTTDAQTTNIVDREGELADRMNKLRARLPSDMPEEQGGND